jgi:hypothetical protein
VVDRRRKFASIEAQRTGEPIAIPYQCLLDAARRFGGDQDGHDPTKVAGFMEVLQIKPVAIDLVHARAIKLLLVAFVLNNKDDPALKDDQIGPSAHPWYQELHEEMCGWQLSSQRP